MDVFKTHGAFSWSELMTSDPEKAATFYGSLFGWKIENMPMPGQDGAVYRVAKVGDVAIGGVSPFPQGQQMPTAWSSYVTVDDVDATVAKARELGATILMPPMDIPTVGRMAALQDPVGAVINVITYAAPAA